jgi:phage N-6-adenine-methyltransferase
VQVKAKQPIRGGLIVDQVQIEAAKKAFSHSKWDVLHSSKKEDWATPQALFDGLNRRYGPFDLDAAASNKNSKTRFYFSDNGLTADWQDPKAQRERTGAGACMAFFPEPPKAVWLNPPYGRNIGAWLRKAADEAEKGCRVVCLVPSRTGSRWFRDAAARCSEVVFIVGRITFDGAPSPAPFDSAVIVFEPQKTYVHSILGEVRSLPHDTKVTWIKREELYK